MFYQILTWTVSIFLIICVYGFSQDSAKNNDETSVAHFVPAVLFGIAAIALVKYCPC